MTAPVWPADIGKLIATTHRQDFTARIQPVGGGDPIPVTPTACTVQFSASQSPRVTASLTIPVPTDQAVIDALDPRRGARLLIDAGYIYPSGQADLQPMVNLTHWKYATDRGSDSVTIDARGDEAKVVERGVDVEVNRPAGGNTAAELAWIITNAIPDAVINIQTAGVAFDAWQLRYGDNPWRKVEDLADTADLECFYDGLDGFVIRRQPTVATSGIYMLQTGGGGTIETATTDTNRDLFGNGYVALYEWRNPAGTEFRVAGKAYITVGLWAWGGPAGKQLRWTKRDTPVSLTQANTAAAALLQRVLASGRGVDLTAVSALWLRPGHTVDIQLPLGATMRQLVQNISYDLAEGRMQVTTRDPNEPPE